MGTVSIAPFSNRLAYSVPSNVQGIRCLSNFQALRFAEPTRTLADKMVERMVKNSSILKENMFQCIFGLKWIWLHFPDVNMIVGKKRNMKWILLEKEVGEENLGEGAEL
ncbi:O-fucosyltransferase 9-like isoform X2 [Hibiscus syriacus]|uniref:O-fucosyltransferase 9-like isoform X2 n=1 Tax=Hibiscus syriacus TaxID=106335 RepID=UPI0019247917|nr:O-fucosyltransferase 9-like isoform X2 [Hibiscus syriacus]